MPFSHASGLYTFFGFHVYWATPVTFAITNRPFTADFILEQLAHAPDDVDSISLPPSVLEELSATENGCEVLSKLKFVVFGGGKCLKQARTSSCIHFAKIDRHGNREPQRCYWTEAS